MADLLSEVDDMMRQERMEKLWKEHGKTVLAGIALIILGTALGAGWRSWNESVRVRQTDALLAMLDAKDFPANIAAMEDLDMRGGQRGIALLTAAGALMQDDKPEEARALYARAAEDSGIPSDLRDLAVLMNVRLGANADAADIKTLQGQLKSVWKNGKSPWAAHAHLESSALYASSGDFEAARDRLAAVQKMENLPETLYSKARALDHIYALKAAGPAAKTETGDADS